MQIVDTQRDFTRGLFLSDNGINVPVNALGPGTYNWRLQAGGSLKSRLGMGPLVALSGSPGSLGAPIGYYAYAEEMTVAGSPKVGTSATADFLVHANNGGTNAFAGGVTTSGWLLAVKILSTWHYYPITAVTAHTVTATGMPDGPYASGDWFVCYAGVISGIWRWYKDTDTSVARTVVHYGKRVDVLTDAGAILGTYIFATLTTVKTIFTQLSTSVCVSNGTDAPVFCGPDTGSFSVAGSTATDIPPHKCSAIFMQRLVYGHMAQANALTTWHPVRMDYSLLNDIGQLEGDSKEIGDAGTKGLLRAMFPWNDSLWFLLDKSVYQASGNTMDTLRITEAFAGVGCCSQATVASVAGQMIWLDGRPAIWAFSGGMPREISRPIREAMEALTPDQIAASFAFSYGGRYYITFGGQSVTYIYDPLFDPQDSIGGGWVTDNYGLESASVRRAAGETYDFLAVLKASTAAAPTYIVKCEMAAKYYDDPTPNTSAMITPVVVTTRRTTQTPGMVKKFKRWIGWFQLPTGNVDLVMYQDTGLGSWVSVPIVTPLSPSNSRRVFAWLVKNSTDAIRLSLALSMDEAPDKEYILHGYDLYAETVGR